MRSLMAALMALGLGVAAAAAAAAETPRAEAGVGATLWFPGAGDYDLFDTSYGASFSYRHWCSPPVGYEVSLGYGIWPSGEGTQVGSHLTDFRGEAEVLPLTVSALMEVPDTDFALEAGLSYVLIGSGISAFNTDSGQRSDVSIDDCVLGVVSLQRDWEIGNDQVLGVSAGYQFDLLSGDLSTGAGSAGQTDLQAFFLRVSLRWKL